jgi:NADPH-dependent ferric siderophore reductase
MMDDIINQTDRSGMNLETPTRRVQRVRHELKRRELQVLRVATLSPHVRSVTFGGPDIAGFVSASFDDHIKLFLPGDAGQPVMRDYTPRHHDAAAGELSIEFALHGDGPAARWAAQAAPGQRVGIGGPRGSFIVPTDYDWHLLAGDETALPAIARRLQELPAGAVVQLLLRVGAADRRELGSAADVQLHWCDDGTALLAAARALVLPPGEGYAWCAGEARLMAQLRQVLVFEKGHPASHIRAAAYWKQGASGHHENLEG